jgi:hypothetical protein
LRSDTIDRFFYRATMVTLHDGFTDVLSDRLRAELRLLLDAAFEGDCSDDDWNHALGALSTGTHVFYERFGWQRWRGPTFVDGLRGRERTADEDGGVMVLRTPRSPRLDLDGAIVCD